MPTPLYEAKSAQFLSLDRNFYARVAEQAHARKRVNSFIVPIRSGRAWEVRAGQVCRIVASKAHRLAI